MFHNNVSSFETSKIGPGALKLVTMKINAPSALKHYNLQLFVHNKYILNNIYNDPVETHTYCLPSHSKHIQYH